MNKKIIFYVGLYAVVAYGAYYLYNNTKRAYVAKILKAGLSGGGEAALLAFDKDYLKEWSIAAKTGAPNFMYKGVNYVSKGGKSLK